MESNSNETSRYQRQRSNSYQFTDPSTLSSIGTNTTILPSIPSNPQPQNANLDDSDKGFDSSYNNSGPLRKGKWTIEEENYANKIICMFNQGILEVPVGTTLRSYLSEKLNWYV